MDNCAICDARLLVRWSDTHGVGVCGNCGLPYLIYHYENDKRVDRPPEIAVRDDWMPIARKYWDETKSRVFPAAYDMGILSSRGASYSGATSDECAQWDTWLREHKAELPKREPEAEPTP